MARGIGTYGLNTQVSTSTPGGGGLLGQGVSDQALATRLAGRAAEEETARNAENRRRETARKAGNAQLGATAGAMAGAQWGSSMGPWGTVIGGILGGVAGSLF